MGIGFKVDIGIKFWLGIFSGTLRKPSISSETQYIFTGIIDHKISLKYAKLK